ncbi:MAG: hypothetical protein D6823_01310, partial [Chloroflexi bacterium]
PTDGWGASAMLGALFEGLAGVFDDASRYEEVIISPRWPVEPTVKQAYVVTRYPASTGYVAYRWQRDDRSLRLLITGSGRQATVRFLLPTDVGDRLTMMVDNQPVTPLIEVIGNSRYASVTLDRLNVEVMVTWP